MALSLRAKRGLVAFGVFDLAVIIALVFLFGLRSEINLKEEHINTQHSSYLFSIDHHNKHPVLQS